MKNQQKISILGFKKKKTKQWTTDMTSRFTEKGTHTVHKHIQTCSMPSIIGKTGKLIQTQVWLPTYHFGKN